MRLIRKSNGASQSHETKRMAQLRVGGWEGERAEDTDTDTRTTCF